MLPGFIVREICYVAQLASDLWKSFAHYRTRPEDFELFSSEIATLRTTLLAVEEVLSSDHRSCSEVFELLSSDITTLRTTLLAVEKVLSSYSHAPLKGINFPKQAVTDNETKLKQALGILKRYGDFTLKEGGRIKDRPRNKVWEEMERLRGETRRLRGRMGILQNYLGFRTSPILVEGRVDRLFTVRVDHQCDPITHGMQKPCTAIVLSPNGLNTHTSGDKGFCGTFIETMLVTCLATLQKHLGPRRDFVKYLMISCKTTAPPRPASGPERPCWGPQANSESRTCPQHSALPSSKLERFLHRIRTGLPFTTSSPVVLLSPLLFAPSVGALEPGCVSTHNGVSWAQALRSTQTDLISLWTQPLSLSPSPEPATDPTTILLATFLSTTTIALAAQAGKNDAYQSHIVGFCAIMSAIWAAGLGVGVREFVFGYLFWACVAGVGGSWVVHRAMAAGKARRGFVGKVVREGEMEGI